METVELEKLRLQLSVFEKEQQELREQVRSIATEYASELAGLESGVVDAEFTVKPDSKG
jgi:division protein CdvB (Snf7/Vps24/ESCRT-III family)